ncbi:MAG: hypothetical protein HZY76_20215 [Anaerolineae bacterium]|nr:MAG: hypothetical protein HZY76_20215 [Anaerolineae bacterium]
MTASLPAHTQTPTWQPYAALISQVVLAERLREVRALVDFTQLEPLGSWAIRTCASRWFPYRWPVLRPPGRRPPRLP